MIGLFKSFHAELADIKIDWQCLQAMFKKKCPESVTKAMYRSARIFVQTSISILDIVYNPLWYQIKDSYNTICFAYAKT